MCFRPRATTDHLRCFSVLRTYSEFSAEDPNETLDRENRRREKSLRFIHLNIYSFKQITFNDLIMQFLLEWQVSQVNNSLLWKWVDFYYLFIFWKWLNREQVTVLIWSNVTFFYCSVSQDFEKTISRRLYRANKQKMLNFKVDIFT